MSIILRGVGILWVLLNIKPVFNLVSRLLKHGAQIHFGLNDLLSLVLLASGIGLILLKEWGRWMGLAGAGAYVLTWLLPALLKWHIGPVVIQNILFYGVFLVLLLIPQAKATTR